jgi:hypothetical protein
MSRFVFVLGAGASCDAKAPLASNFMDKARLLLRGGSLSGQDVPAFDLVFKAREALKAAHSKACLDLTDIEALFGAFEMASLFGRLGSLSEQEVDCLPSAMRRLISRTVELSMEFPVLPSPSIERMASHRYHGRSGPYPMILPAANYESFAKMLASIARGQLRNVSVITFNYDLGSDYAFHFAGMPFNYCLEPAPNAALDLLKLHGSLNWGRCSRCKTIVPLDIPRCVEETPIQDPEKVNIEVSQRLGLLQHCGFPLPLEPVIVPPTWNKGMYHAQLGHVWKKAAAHLSEAEYIFIIGYSYPSTDEFFRYLYALGSIGEGWVEKIIVFNPDSAVGGRFRGLLGPLVAGKFIALTNTFEQAIPYIQNLNLS